MFMIQQLEAARGEAVVLMVIMVGLVEEEEAEPQLEPLAEIHPDNKGTLVVMVIPLLVVEAVGGEDQEYLQMLEVLVFMI
jgi:hypothetical protein